MKNIIYPCNANLMLQTMQELSGNFLKAEFLLNKKDACAEDVKWRVLKYFALLYHLVLYKHLPRNFCHTSGS